MGNLKKKYGSLPKIVRQMEQGDPLMWWSPIVLAIIFLIASMLGGFAGTRNVFRLGLTTTLIAVSSLVVWAMVTLYCRLKMWFWGVGVHDQEGALKALTWFVRLEEWERAHWLRNYWWALNRGNQLPEIKEITGDKPTLWKLPEYGEVNYDRGIKLGLLFLALLGIGLPVAMLGSVPIGLIMTGVGLAGYILLVVLGL